MAEKATFIAMSVHSKKHGTIWIPKKINKDPTALFNRFQNPNKEKKVVLGTQYTTVEDPTEKIICSYWISEAKFQGLRFRKVDTPVRSRNWGEGGGGMMLATITENREVYVDYCTD